MKLYTLVVVCCLLFTTVFGQAFITTWNTNDNRIYIPGLGSNYTVSWVEVGNPSVTGSTTISDASTVILPHAGNYKVSISGGAPAFNAIRFSGSTEGRKLVSIDQWGSIPWSSMANAFNGCQNLVVNATDNPNLSNVTDLSQMFEDCRVLRGNFSNWNTSNITNMSRMFYDSWAFNEPIGDWNTSNVKTMQSMFFGASAFNQPIGSWNTSRVMDMNHMFGYADAFNQPIGSWDMGNVLNTDFMFGAATTFNQSLDSWNMSSDTNMINMFYNASSFNQPIGSWNTSSVTNMSSMFNGYTTNFNQPINTWNTANVKDMISMFAGAKSFNQPLNSWNVGNVTNMNSMFHNATSFNQPLNNWNTGKVTDMGFMFVYDSLFNQNLGSWNIEKVINMENMLSVSGLSVSNYDSTMIGWSTQPVESGVSVGAVGLKYCNALAERNNLVTIHGWTISGDAMDCSLIISSVKLCPGSDTSFTPSFSGAGYQWQIDRGSGFTNITDNVNYSGALTHTLQLRDIPSSFYGNKYRCIVDGVNTNSFQVKFVNEWIGANGTSWENSSNWSCGSIPDANTDVIFNEGTAIINLSTTIRSLTINPSANLIVNSPAILTLTH